MWTVMPASTCAWRRTLSRSRRRGTRMWGRGRWRERASGRGAGWWRAGGDIALIGVLTGVVGEVSIGAVFSNQIRISGISIGSRADQQDMIRAINANRLKPVIDRSFPLAEIVAAFKYYESQKHFGKVCLEL